MISKHQEIEAKLDAEKVNIQEFKKFMSKLDNEGNLHVKGPDGYYVQGDRVLRHRVDSKGGTQELTVKLRRSLTDIRDRLEIDLKFDDETSPHDVKEFLSCAGYTHAFTLVKDAHIFWINITPKTVATFVIYDVWKEEKNRLTGKTRKIDKKRFVEVEIEKNSAIKTETAKRHIRKWVKILQKKFKLKSPLNSSLYELYSGETYRMV